MARQLVPPVLITPPTVTPLRVNYTIPVMRLSNKRSIVVRIPRLLTPPGLIAQIFAWLKNKFASLIKRGTFIGGGALDTFLSAATGFVSTVGTFNEGLVRFLADFSKSNPGYAFIMAVAAFAIFNFDVPGIAGRAAADAAEVFELVQKFMAARLGP